MPKDAAGPPQSKSRLRSFAPIAGVGIPNTGYKTVSLGSNIDTGAQGTARVIDVWLDGTSVHFTLRFLTPGHPDKTLYYLNAPGTAEPITDAEYEAFRAKLERELPGR